MDWIRDHLWETWLGLSIVLGVAEMFSLDLILAMLAAGAVIGMVAALIGLPVVVQILAALAASVAALALVRPAFVKRLHSGPELSLGHGKLVGTPGHRHRGDHRPRRRPDQGRRRDLDRAALRRAPAGSQPARPSRSCRSRARRPTSTRSRRSSPEAYPPPTAPPPATHSHRGRPHADSPAGPAPARRPVRRRHARQDGPDRAPGTRRHRRALRQVQGHAARRPQHPGAVHRPAALPHRPARAGRVASRRSP